MIIIKSKKFIQTAILIGVSAAISFLFVSFIVQADWTPPTETAPTCGLSEPACNTPINVSGSAQVKIGPLGIGGLFTAYSDAYFTGNVGIGTPNPGTNKLQVNGKIQAIGGDICTDQGGGKCLSATTARKSSFFGSP